MNLLIYNVSVVLNGMEYVETKTVNGAQKFVLMLLIISFWHCDIYQKLRMLISFSIHARFGNRRAQLPLMLLIWLIYLEEMALFQNLRLVYFFR